MFEKESIKWATKELGNGYVDDIDNHSQTFQKGAEFGYNEANKWRYPSKGEYPKDEFADEYTKPRLPSSYKRFYCLCLGDDCVMGKYIRGSFWTVEGRYSLNEIAAWKEIAFPELKKSE